MDGMTEPFPPWPARGYEPSIDSTPASIASSPVPYVKQPPIGTKPASTATSPPFGAALLIGEPAPQLSAKAKGKQRALPSVDGPFQYVVVQKPMTFAAAAAATTDDDDDDMDCQVAEREMLNQIAAIWQHKQSRDALDLFVHKSTAGTSRDHGAVAALEKAHADWKTIGQQQMGKVQDKQHWLVPTLAFLKNDQTVDGDETSSTDSMASKRDVSVPNGFDPADLDAAAANFERIVLDTRDVDLDSRADLIRYLRHWKMHCRSLVAHVQDLHRERLQAKAYIEVQYGCMQSLRQRVQVLYAQVTGQDEDIKELAAEIVAAKKRHATQLQATFAQCLAIKLGHGNVDGQAILGQSLTTSVGTSASHTAQATPSSSASPTDLTAETTPSLSPYYKLSQ